MSQVSKALWKMTDPVKNNNQVDDAGIKETATGFGPAPELKPAGSTKASDTFQQQDRDESVADLEVIREGALIEAESVYYDSNQSEGESNAGNRAYADANLDEVDNIDGQIQDIQAQKTELPPMQTINVTQDFPWTYSPESSRVDVPTMILREERLLQNPVFNSLSYNLFTMTDHIPPEWGDAAKKFTDDSLGWLSDMAGTGAQKAVQVGSAAAEKLGIGSGGATGETTGKIVSTFIKEAGGIVKEMVSQDDLSEKYKNWNTEDYRQHLEPYQRLFSTYPTGFKYKIPYFDDAYKQAGGGFGDSDNMTAFPFMGSLSKIGGFVGSVMESLNAAGPGTYIEQPKYPAFPTSEKSYTLNFMLHNTSSWEDTLRNWQLVFMLIYQNIPNRVNRTVILPPKIYEARLPGVWYSRYSYMSTVAVQMQGARRDMMIPAGELGLPRGLEQFKTIVPDAYQVSITLQELIPESQNYMFESIIRDSLVTVDERDSANVVDNIAAVKNSTMSGAVDSLQAKSVGAKINADGTWSQAGADPTQWNP